MFRDKGEVRYAWQKELKLWIILLAGVLFILFSTHIVQYVTSLNIVLID